MVVVLRHDVTSYVKSYPDVSRPSASATRLASNDAHALATADTWRVRIPGSSPWSSPRPLNLAFLTRPDGSRRQQWCHGIAFSTQTDADTTTAALARLLVAFRFMASSASAHRARTPEGTSISSGQFDNSRTGAHPTLQLPKASRSLRPSTGPFSWQLSLSMNRKTDRAR